MLNKTFLLVVLLLQTAFTCAYEMRVTQEQLQQELNKRMPLTKQRGMFVLTMSDPTLTLLSDTQRAQIRAFTQVQTSIGLQSQGMVTVSGKVRYNKDNYSFYIDDPEVTELALNGVPPSFQPQLIKIAQDAITPAVKDQPVYTLSDEDMTQSMARMMLQSINIEGQEVVIELSPF